MIVKIKDFQIPKKLEVDDTSLTHTYGKFIAEPFERGFGATIGNSIRRVLLSLITGAAVTSLKIDGVLHEFSTIPSVKEDVTDIILNIKSLRIKLYTDKPKTIYIQKKGPGAALGSDIIHDADVEILTPDLVIATLEKEAKLDIEMTVKLGRGYVIAEHNKEDGLPIGVIPVDSIFSPVQRVNFRVENARVGRRTDFDRLILEVWTDGSMPPEEAVSNAAIILKDHLNIFITSEEVNDDDDDDEPFEIASSEDSVVSDKSQEEINKNLTKNVEELELSVRSANCLKNAKIFTIADLVQRSETEMLETKNFGRKSLNEIKALLNGMGLNFGMKIDSLDKDNERQ
ncbi:MAG: DNA-directed RNA polymerase subunit alpha [Nitrospirae bacterium GWA2_42_11]|nr:MAG: DNA-directed RNA polymerase subunit alpha [Nitrospirae bacterium GWA2_42_11]OGW58901.1 MAG: DNA-directed RNA polymerase subunit alpha [Nitrospirae bacterium RIFCSPHIGHO2_02_FULL_42_12]